jgi:hypothetical protein
MLISETIQSQANYFLNSQNNRDKTRLIMIEVVIGK